MNYVKILKTGLTGLVLEDKGSVVLVRVMNPMWPFPKDLWYANKDVRTTRAPKFIVERQPEEAATW